jgi:predicted N-formylglutamate amidohydrolase
MKKLLLTCEHGGNQIPEPFQALFLPHHELLQTHRGWDIGALELAKDLSEKLQAPLFYSTTSRLLIELNRSLDHPELFSEVTKELNQAEKEVLIEEHMQRHWNQVEQFVHNEINEGTEIIHIGIHSFTPILNGEVRNCDIGLLFEANSPMEESFCNFWKSEFEKIAPELVVKLNYPYNGSADGFTTYLRKKFPDNYIGVELEVKNSLLELEGERIIKIIEDSLRMWGNF